MANKPSQRTFDNLKGVHPDLVKVVLRALELSAIDFVVVDGVRTAEQEAVAVAKGKSATLHSLHLIQPDGYAHAVDCAALVGGKVNWQETYYIRINNAFHDASQELNVPIEWGGIWSYPHDCDHWQLNRAVYSNKGKS